MKTGGWCLAVLVGAGLLGQADAAASRANTSNPELCVNAGEAMAIEVRFDAGYQNKIELRVGEQVLRRFDNWFGKGADADQGAGSWQLPVFRTATCITIVSHHRPSGMRVWKGNRYKQHANGYGFEDATDNDFDDAQILFSVQTPVS